MVSSLGLFYIILLGRFLDIFFCVQMYPFLLAIYLGMKILGHKISATLANDAKQFSKAILTFPLAVYENSSYSTPHQLLVLFTCLFWPFRQK